MKLPMPRVRFGWPRWLRWPGWQRWRWNGSWRRRGGVRRRPARGIAVLFAAVLLALAWWLGGSSASTWQRREILDAIRYVESGDREDVVDGDGGLAIGPYQIHEVYWRDAMRSEPKLGGRYQDCRRRDYAERVIDAYMRLHAADAWRRGDAEVIARVHNGGPSGASKQTTRRYWRAVRARLP